MAEAKKWAVKFLQTLRGDRPVENFIKEQDRVVYSKILNLVILLQNNGPFLRPPQSKKIAQNLYELRTKGQNPTRILYTYHNSTYYLLHAFKKKSQKTPARDLKTALDRAKNLI